MLSNRYFVKENCLYWKFEVWFDENKCNFLKKVYFCREEEWNVFLSYLVLFMCVFVYVLYRDMVFVYVIIFGNYKSIVICF